MCDTLFALDPRLVDTGRVLAELELCSAILVNDARFPWLVLVPRRAGLVDLTDLAGPDRDLVWREMDAAARAASALCPLDRPMAKLNIASLGNMVRQLHVHVIARRADDPAWPGPVWGVGAAEPYADFDAACVLAREAL